MIAWLVLALQVFPLTVKAYWLPNPLSDDVTSYAITLDGGAPITVPPVTTNDSNCPIATYPAGCVLQTIVVPVAGSHTFSVVAINQFGPSLPLSVTMNINVPGKIVWVRVAK